MIPIGQIRQRGESYHLRITNTHKLHSFVSVRVGKPHTAMARVLVGNQVADGRSARFLSKAEHVERLENS